MGTPNTYTTSDLISLIKLVGHVPQANATFTQADFLTLADLELRTYIARMLKEANEGYFQTYVEFDQNDTGIYTMPSNSMGSTTFVLQIRNGQAIWPVSVQNVAEMTTTTFPSTGNWTYYIQGNTINLLPIQFGGVLRIVYERRPSKLVPVTSCGQISAINSNVLTVTSVPSAWVVGNTIDFQQAQPQFDILGAGEITNISGTDITVDAVADNLAVGDFICLSDQTCVPQVPVEFTPLLAQRVVCKIYELQGYMDKLKTSQAKLEEMEKSLTSMISPRTQSAPKVINPSWGGRKPGSAWAKYMPPASGHGS